MFFICFHSVLILKQNTPVEIISYLLIFLQNIYALPLQKTVVPGVDGKFTVPLNLTISRIKAWISKEKKKQKMRICNINLHKCEEGIFPI